MRNGHAHVGYRLPLGVEHFAKNPARRAQLHHHVIILAGNDVDGGAAQTGEINARRRIPFQTGADGAAADRDAFQFKIAEGIRPHQRHPARHQGIGSGPAIVKLHPSINPGHILQGDVDVADRVRGGRDLPPHSFPLAVEGHGDQIQFLNRQPVGFPIAVRIGIENPDDIPQSFSVQPADKNLPPAMRRQIVRLEHLPAQGAVGLGHRRKRNHQIGNLTGRIQHVDDCPSQTIARFNVHREDAQGHPVKSELTRGIGKDTPPQFARIGIRKKIYGRPRHRRGAIRLHHRPQHRGPPPEPQGHRHGLTFPR
ncbi:MAG: hypothetical protein BWX84_00203 [Verrucomicrobia bacterium ADurb.Bin118]|nr:MAG: hypothetical protein BWX84_00203 [Verrucomicrobia bacterium ADurb.Bin118]